MGKLNMRAGVSIVITIILSGCPASSMEGQFLPACPAYAGDSISLSNGRYEWDKFTDMVNVDADGSIVDNTRSILKPAHTKSTANVLTICPTPARRRSLCIFCRLKSRFFC